MRSKRGRNLNKGITPQNKSKTNDWIVIVSMLILGLFGIWYFYKKSEDYQLDRNELASIELTLDSKPSIIKGSKGSKSLEMKIREYPNFRFNLSGVAYSATNTSNFIENTEGGSRITLIVDKEDYAQKLIKSEEATFWVKHINYKNISIYGIKDDKQTYLTISSYEENNKNDSMWGVWGIIGIFLYIGYEAWKERNNKRLKR